MAIPGIKRDDTLDPAYFAKKPRGGSSGDLDDLIRRITYLEECCAEVQPELETLRRAIEILNGDETVDGSVKQLVNDAVNEILDNAPEAFDTLKEVADWIEDNSTIIHNLEVIVNELNKMKPISLEEIENLF